MLATPTTELWTPSACEFPPPPPRDVSLRQIANRASDFAHTAVRSNSEIFTAARAEIEGGNCYARAEIAAATLAFWGLESFIILNYCHASNFVREGDEAEWFSAGSVHRAGVVAGIPKEAEGLNSTLATRHKSLADRGRQADESVAEYFWRTEDDIASLQVEDTINSPLPPSSDRGVHIVVSARKGIEMLHALGKLKAYRKLRPEKYAQVYDDLIDLVPSFRLGDVPPPHKNKLDRLN